MARARQSCLSLLSAAALLLLLPVAAQAAPQPRPGLPALPHGPLCGALGVGGFARCHAHVVLEAKGGRPLASSSPPATALTPTQIAHAYGFDKVDCFAGAHCGSGQTIAIVDAFDAPNVAGDLATFSSQFGLPAANLVKATPQGQPGVDGGWAQEISLDVEWAHAVAPAATILLVEAADNSYANLLGAVDYAVANGATVVSMSWGGGEFSSETSNDSHFSTSGVTFVASAGDGGHGAEYPSASPYVTSVGGTKLPVDGAGNRTGAETAWSCSSSFDCAFNGGTGGGASSYEKQPDYQSAYGIASGGSRATPDVAYVGDPSTGVAVYDSTPFNGSSGWLQIGGTSVGAPQWAALIALARKSGAPSANADLYKAGTGSAYGQDYSDITAGQNGNCATCSAGTGYDQVTGMGVPQAGALVPALAPNLGKLAFVNFGSSLAAGASTSGSVQLQDSGGTAVNAPSGGVSVTLGSSSSAGAFTPPSPIAIAAGSSSATFQYSDTKAGSSTVTARANNYSSASQVETISAGPASQVTVSPGSATVAQGGQQAFTAAAADQYGNQIDAPPATWTLSPTSLGSVSPTSGASTTFTASGSGTGTGSLTAKVGSATGSANLTVSTVTEAVTNGGFEKGDLSGWMVAASHPAPTVSASQAHGGKYAAHLGSAMRPKASGDSAITQDITVPASASPTLTFWYRPSSADFTGRDFQEAQIRDLNNNVLAQVLKGTSNSQTWTSVTFDMSAYKGKTVRLWFNVHQQFSFSGVTDMYLDDVSVR